MDHFELSEGTAALTAHAETWNLLAAQRPNPFLSHAWLSQWARGYPVRQVRCATLCDGSGNLLAGALLRTVPLGLGAAATPTTDWDAVAVDDHSRRQLWDNIARTGAQRFALSGLYVGTRETDIASSALAEAGYGILPSVREFPSPYITLPASFEELLAARSRNTRKQLRKRRRDLEAAGRLSLRTTLGGPDLERDLDELIRVEASGWKGREGTAITSNATAKQLYRGFAQEAAKQGWLRLYLLELDDAVIAAQLAISLGSEMFLLKTGFDEAWAAHSPGFVLTAEVIERAIADGLRGVDMQGRADEYKMTWADTVRPRQRLRVVRGAVGRTAQRGWNSVLHPRLVRLRDRAREDQKLRRRLERAQNLFVRSR